MVSSEDDLGPELIMNIKWLDSYRYNPQTLFMYLDIMQEYRNKQSWQQFFNSPVVSHSGNNDVKDVIINCMSLYLQWHTQGVQSLFGREVSRAPFYIHLLN